MQLIVASVEPCTIMLEYVYFDFEPFGRLGRVSSLEEFLGFVEIREVGDQFPFQYEIAEDMCRGLAHLHELGIVHRDIKPANVLVSNQHYCSLSNKNDLQELFEVQPIVCKLADFGELLCRKSNGSTLSLSHKQHSTWYASIQATRIIYS